MKKKTYISIKSITTAPPITSNINIDTRITYFFIALLAAIVAGCSGCDPKDAPTEEVRVLDFDSLITADYNYVDTLCGDSNFFFYESTAMFADSMQISKVVSLFQKGDTVIQITHTPEKDSVDVFQDFVLEDCVISMPLKILDKQLRNVSFR